MRAMSGFARLSFLLLAGAPCAALAQVSIEQPEAEARISVEAGEGAASLRIADAADGEGRPVAVEAQVQGAPAGFAGHRVSGRMTSGFGYRVHPVLGGIRIHSGIDLAAPTGTSVIASSAGTVCRAGWASGYGLLVVIDHGGGVQTRYGHLSGLAVAIGQHVRAGDVLGYVGSTGRSTGPHLHYEVRRNGAAVDPLGGRRAH